MKADLRGQIHQGSNGYQVYFKNFGTKTIHFGFYLGGAQSSDAMPGNRRIHLKPGNVAGPLLVKPEPDAKGAIKLHAVQVSEGNTDSPSPSAS